MLSEIDIIIPTFNRAFTLDRSIRSVFAQKFKKFTLWVVDDGSTDETRVLLKKWQRLFPDRQMRVIHQALNRGVSFARNLGLEEGRAKWVAFLDSDDEWLDEKLGQQMGWVAEHPEHLLVHTNEIWIRDGKQVNQKKKHRKRGGRVFVDNLWLCCISPSAVLVQRELLNQVGFFREDFPVCEDYEMWLRITSRTLVGFVERPLVRKYGGHSGQLSKKYKAMDEWRVRALAEHLENPLLAEYERRELLHVLREKCQILLKGYEKHKNYFNQEEIKKIYQKSLLFSGK